MSILQDFKEIKSSSVELRKFGWTVGGVFALLGAWMMWRHGASTLSTVFLSAGVSLAAAGAAVPAILLPIQKIWMGLALCMGFVMTRVLLTVLFYLVIVPIGLVLRLTGKDPLNRRLDPQAASYWEDHAKADEAGAYRQF